MLRKIIFSFMLAVATVITSQSEVVRYGYAPEVVSEEYMRAQGTGANGFIYGMICLDPATDPVVARLKGHEILGVRCYMLSDYKQSKQKRTKIMHTTGSPTENVVEKVCDFTAGWNEIYFDEPVKIGEEKTFVGIQVYELRGTPYPLVSFGNAEIAGGCWINIDKNGWEEYSDHGTLMIQAILDEGAADKVTNIGRARLGDYPLTIAPSEMFDATIFVGNYRDEAVNSLTLETIGQGDSEAHVQEITFDTPLAAKEGRMVEASIRAGAETGMNQWIKLRVTAMNGKATDETAGETTYHYVTVDAFERIPLIEEFTSQYCTNCPFMIYYLDMAMEMYDGEYIYLTRHSGYREDNFTQPCDNELVYLFNEKDNNGNWVGFNPAVMYDRYVADGEVRPVIGASLAEPGPYYEQIAAAALRPAKASVNIEFSYDETAGTITPKVSGRIGSEIAASGDPVYLSVYLVEDGIELDDRRNFQYGLDDETAPVDLVEKFRHNGIIRHDFCEEPKGYLLELEEDGTYSIDCPTLTLSAGWKVENCKLVAYANKRNEADMGDNDILNANYAKLKPSGVEKVNVDGDRPVAVVDQNGGLNVSGEVAEYSVYGIDGNKVRADESLSTGIYIVDCKMNDGSRRTVKIAVR